MKSIKPGRGPSAMNAIGSVAAVIFGIFWTIMASSMGAPAIFPLFGVVFIGLGIAQAVYHFKNATEKNRFSAFDITDGSEEPDPLQQRFHATVETAPYKNSDDDVQFCPYCGTPVQAGFEFCAKCGKKLPQ